jgi:hypothetical protein
VLEDQECFQMGGRGYSGVRLNLLPSSSTVRADSPPSRWLCLPRKGSMATRPSTSPISHAVSVSTFLLDPSPSSTAGSWQGTALAASTSIQCGTQALIEAARADYSSIETIQELPLTAFSPTSLHHLSVNLPLPSTSSCHLVVFGSPTSNALLLLARRGHQGAERNAGDWSRGMQRSFALFLCLLEPLGESSPASPKLTRLASPAVVKRGPSPFSSRGSQVEQMGLPCLLVCSCCRSRRLDQWLRRYLAVSLSLRILLRPSSR